MTLISDSVLVESKSARNNQLEHVSHDRAQEILNKVKAIYFILSIPSKTSQVTIWNPLNPKSTRDRNRVKKILSCNRWDYDSGKGWSIASYLREYKVLSDEVYNQALRVVLTELAASPEPNLFVHQFQQASLPDSNAHINLVEPPPHQGEEK